ncbi:hypothetical protein ACJIZ3_014275 [Penstemon smallii]|uniref:Uncharacterized protein n=1 Tax=Penstemon smallii TaxID=265156 RepID=A0ABD3RL12_9LAMI
MDLKRSIHFLVQYKTLSTYIFQYSVGLKLDSILGAAFALQLFVFDYENPPPLLGKIPLKSEFIPLNNDNDLNNLVKMYANLGDDYIHTKFEDVTDPDVSIA